MRVLLDPNACLDVGAPALGREIEHRRDRRRIVVDDQPDPFDEAFSRLRKLRPDRDRNDGRVLGAPGCDQRDDLVGGFERRI